MPENSDIYIITKILFCQEAAKMENPDIPPLKELIVKALELCTDTDLLDLVYKLLLSDVIQ
jgi:hypothetical protein